MTLSSPMRAILRITAFGAVAGAIYSAFAHDEILSGVVIGAANAMALPWVEIVVLRRWVEPLLRPYPFLVTLLARFALLFAVVVAVNATFVPLFNGFSLQEIGQPPDIVFALGASLVGSVAIGVADLIGVDVFFAFVAGRYHRPRVEERALLFLDLCASTETAERLGGPRFLDFLNAVFADLTPAVEENGGEIHKYVGDEIIATWRLSPGCNPPRILAAWAAARRRIASAAERYAGEFGLTPDFRAALHAGEVVVGELGARKKEIALIGDPMNTAARMLEACRGLGFPALASATLIERLDAAPDGIEPKPITALPLRGKSAPLALYALADREAPEPQEVVAGA